MAITYFFIGANSGFVNKINGSKKVAYDNWLENKANKNPQALRREEEIRYEVSKLHTHRIELQRKQEETNQNNLWCMNHFDDLYDEK